MFPSIRSSLIYITSLSIPPIQRLFLQSQKGVSLVDCLSFEIMESFDIPLAFTFDSHFEDMGFSIVR